MIALEDNVSVDTIINVMCLILVGSMYDISVLTLIVICAGFSVTGYIFMMIQPYDIQRAVEADAIPKLDGLNGV